jgi:hypothetical protein
LCSWIVLVAEVDERRLVQVGRRAGQPAWRALGLATRPRARAAKGRQKPDRGGEAARTVAGSRRSRRVAQAALRGSEHSSREGVLASTKPSSLTRRRRRRAWRSLPGGFGRKAGAARRGPRQRASEATSQARLAVENAAVGRRSAEELLIEAPPGPRSVRPGGRLGPRPQTRCLGVTTTPKLEVRRQAKLHPGIRRRPLAKGGSARLRGPKGARRSELGNRAVQWVLESLVGCRSRRDASFLPPERGAERRIVTETG